MPLSDCEKKGNFFYRWRKKRKIAAELRKKGFENHLLIDATLILRRRGYKVEAQALEKVLLERSFYDS